MHLYVDTCLIHFGFIKGILTILVDTINMVDTPWLC